MIIIVVVVVVVIVASFSATAVVIRLVLVDYKDLTRTHARIHQFFLMKKNQEMVITH